MNEILHLVAAVLAGVVVTAGMLIPLLLKMIDGWVEAEKAYKQSTQLALDNHAEKIALLDRERAVDLGALERIVVEIRGLLTNSMTEIRGYISRHDERIDELFGYYRHDHPLIGDLKDDVELLKIHTKLRKD